MTNAIDPDKDETRDLDYADVDETCWNCASIGHKENWCITCDKEEVHCTCPEGAQHFWEINRCGQCRATW